MKQILKEWFVKNSDWFFKVVIIILAIAIIAQIIFDEDKEANGFFFVMIKA